MVKNITLGQVIEGLETLIREAQIAMNIDGKIDEDTRPGLIIKSQVLLTVIGRLEDLLDMEIPDNCYPFFDKDKLKQLTIREAAEILINKATNDK